MTMLAKRNLFTGPNGKRIEAVTHLGLIGTALLVFLPVSPHLSCYTQLDRLDVLQPAIATFPQRGTISTSSLESQFKDVKDPKTGQVLQEVEFNKGL